MHKKEEMSCINCGGKESRFLFDAKDYRLATTEKNFSVYKCSGCGLMFLNPMPQEDELGIFYPDDYYQPGIALLEKLYSPLIDRCFKKIVNEIKKFKSGGRSLDVGCGTGIFMSYFQREDFDAYGTDLSKKAGSALPNSLKKKITINPFKKNNFDDESFDLITLKQVLEHFVDPNEVLKEVYRTLKPNGILYIEVPNTNCLESRLFKQYWFNLEVPRHTYHFKLNNFVEFIRKNGFEKLRILEGGGIMVFRTPMALVNSFLFYLKNRLNNKLDSKLTLLSRFIFYISFFPLLLLTFTYRLLSTPNTQTDIMVIFQKRKVGFKSDAK